MVYSLVKLEVSVPSSHLEKIANAIHDAGAGRIGAYDRCLVYWPVNGRWRALEGADPFEGEIGQVTHGHELRLDCICPAAIAPQVVAAIRAAHPYEEAVIVALPILDL
jgi:hypothetical protein